MVISLVFSCIVYNNGNWLVFLTKLNVVIILIYFIWGTTISGLYGFKQIPFCENVEDQEKILEELSNENKTKKICFKFFWFWFNFTYLVTFLVFVMYWGYLRSFDRELSSVKSFSVINDHGISFCLLIIDLMFHRIPVRFLHLFYTYFFGIIYLTMAVTLNFANGQSVYYFLDWKNKPNMAVTTLTLSLLFIIVGQIIMIIIYLLKKKK